MADKLISEIKDLSVRSCADGSMRVEIVYHREPIEPGATPVGLSTRFWVAEQIETILKAHLWDEMHGKETREGTER